MVLTIQMSNNCTNYENPYHLKVTVTMEIKQKILYQEMRRDKIQEKRSLIFR